MNKVTLAEAAAEILKASKSNSPAEPIKKLSGVEVQDLGGSTNEKPEGDAVGKNAAAKISQAEQPQKTQVGKSAPVSAEPSKGALKEDEEVDSEEVIADGDADIDQTEENGELDLEEARQIKIEMIKEKMKSIGFSEDINALFNGETLSEDFRNKATVIFESAVISRAIPIVEELEKVILEQAQNTINEVKSDIEERIDGYLDYISEEWLKENAISVEAGLRTEIYDDFITGLRNLFIENYIDVPEEKVDALEAVLENNKELESKLNEALNANIELKQQINESTRKNIIVSVSDGLTATQVEKMKALAEGVEFTTEGEYKEKLNIIKKNYFSTNSVQGSPYIDRDQRVITEETQEVSGPMSHYVKAISRTIVK